MLQVTFNLVCLDWRFLDIYLRLSFRREGRIDSLFFSLIEHGRFLSYKYAKGVSCRSNISQLQEVTLKSFRSPISPSTSWQRSPGQLPMPCRKLPKNCDNLSLCRFPIYRYLASTMSKKLIDTLRCFNIYFQIQSTVCVEIFKHVSRKK